MNALRSRKIFLPSALLGYALFLVPPACAQVVAPGAQSLGVTFTCPANTSNAGRVIPAGTSIPDNAAGNDERIIAYFCGSTSAANSGAYNALGGPYNQLADSLINWLVRSLFGGSNPNNTSASDAAAAAAERARNAEIEREREAELERQRQLEAERQAKFRQDMQQLELVMGGPKLPDETKLFHDNSTCLFNIGCNSDRTLEFQQVDLAHAQQTISNPLDELRISACLSKMAAEAKSPDESKYLSGEAAKAMNGSPVDVDVSGCAAGASTMQAPLTPEQTSLFRALLDSTNREMDRLQDLQDQKVKLETKKTQLKQEIQEKQQLVTQIQQQAPAPPVVDMQTETTAAQQQPQQQSALEDAEAALQAAQKQLANANQNEAQVDNDIKQVGDKLKQNQSCVQQAQADPSKTADLSATCTQ